MHAFLLYVCSTTVIAYAIGIMSFQAGKAQAWAGYVESDLAADMRAKRVARRQIADLIPIFIEQPPERKHVAVVKHAVKPVEHSSQRAYKARLDQLFCDPYDDDPEHFSERMVQMFRIKCPPTKGAFPTVVSNLRFVPCDSEHHSICWRGEPEVAVIVDQREFYHWPTIIGPDDTDRGPPNEQPKARAPVIRHAGNFGKRGKQVKPMELEIPLVKPYAPETNAGLLPKPKLPIKLPDPKLFHQGACIVGPRPEKAYNALRCRQCNMGPGDQDNPCMRLNCPVNYAKLYKDKVQTDDIQDS